MTDKTLSPDPFFDVQIEPHRGRAARDDYDALVNVLKKEGVSQTYKPIPEVEDYSALASFTARIDGGIAGVAVGTVDGTTFNGTRFLVHPRFRKSNVSEDIVKTIQAEDSGFDQIIIDVSPIEGRAMVHDELMHPAISRLVERYKSLGFVDHPSQGVRREMVWRRPAHVKGGSKIGDAVGRLKTHGELRKRINQARDALDQALQASGDAHSHLTIRYEVSPWLKHIERNYPDCEEYMSYHIMKGLTAPTTTTKDDFPGQDSVFALFQKIEKEKVLKKP